MDNILLNEIKKLHDDIFNNNGTIKTDDINKVIKFCGLLTSITGVQCCNKYGNIYEYLPEVYQSVIINMSGKE